MNNRITKLFSEKKENVLSIFATAGYPKLDSTLEVCEALEESGVDLIELGMPYSDPIADGPVIQQVSTEAIKNGMNLTVLFEQLVNLRLKVNIPILLMGYMNPVLQYGVDRFVDDAVRSGVDGVILPDLPIDDYNKHYRKIFEERNLSMVFLVTPQTSDERIRKLDEASSGFLYAVSSPSITGSKLEMAEEQEQYFKRLASLELTNPVLVGFGISDRESFQAACKHQQGAIIGTAFLKSIAQSSDLRSDIDQFIQGIR